ncbi:MAG: ABC transporter substrate-binding protein [Anaerolineae bacterium]|nr:ABC transporter substrate-binding protein [Anaerolineae bacterium]
MAEPTEEVAEATEAAAEPTEEVAEATEAAAEATEAVAEATEAAAEATEAAAEATEVVAEATDVVAEATEAPVVEATIEATPEPAAEATEAAVEATAEATTEAAALIPVSLQLQWVVQSQFAGYFAAKAMGFYEEEGLDVTILEGAVDIVPQQVVASGGAQFGIAWVPKVLESRAAGADLVNIAQVFQRSGTLQVSFKDKGIEGVEDLRGQRVGTWGFGNEHELFAALRAAGIDPNNAEDVQIISQSFDMNAMLNDELDAAQAMTYNEYAQVLEAINPATGELYQPEDLNVINYNDVGTAMLQDHIFSTESWLAGETDGVANTDIAVKFIKASLRGWIYCRDNFDACVQIVLDNGPTLGQSHMQWQLNEINRLIWPSPAGVGVMDQALWDQTVSVAVDSGIIPEAPGEAAFRTDLAQAAVDALTADGVDVTGESWQPVEVTLVEGGK